MKPTLDSIAREDIEVLVKRALGSNARVVNYHITNYSDEKLGFLGAHHNLSVVVQNNRIDKEVHNFFLKTIPHDIAEQASLIKESNVFYKETSFYQKILPELLSSVEDKSWTAKCYLTKDDVLVFEDLKSRNYALRDKYLDIASFKSALNVVAKLHASSMLAEKRLGKTFGELYPDVFRECLFLRNGRLYDWIRNGIDVAIAVAEKIGMDSTFISRIVHRIFESVVASKTKQNVVCHGDLKSFNLMFDNSTLSPKCVIVDFQLLRYAPLSVDLSQMFYLNMRREFRDKHEKDLLRYYHKMLCETLKNSNEKMSLPIFDEILQNYEKSRIVGVVTSVLYTPIHAIDGKLCAELMKDSEGFAKVLMDERVDLVLDFMQRDPLYNDTITEIVKEMVERSEQLLKY